MENINAFKAAKNMYVIENTATGDGIAMDSDRESAREMYKAALDFIRENGGTFRESPISLYAEGLGEGERLGSWGPWGIYWEA